MALTVRQLCQALFQLPDPDALVTFQVPQGHRPLPLRITTFALLPAGNTLPIVAVNCRPDGKAVLVAEDAIDLGLIADPSRCDVCPHCGCLLEVCQTGERCPVCDRPTQSIPGSRPPTNGHKGERR